MILLPHGRLVETCATTNSIIEKLISCLSCAADLFRTRISASLTSDIDFWSQRLGFLVIRVQDLLEVLFFDRLSDTTRLIDKALVVSLCYNAFVSDNGMECY